MSDIILMKMALNGLFYVPMCLKVLEFERNLYTILFFAETFENAGPKIL